MRRFWLGVTTSQAMMASSAFLRNAPRTPRDTRPTARTRPSSNRTAMPLRVKSMTCCPAFARRAAMTSSPSSMLIAQYSFLAHRAELGKFGFLDDAPFGGEKDGARLIKTADAEDGRDFLPCLDVFQEVDQGLPLARRPASGISGFEPVAAA